MQFRIVVAGIGGEGIVFLTRVIAGAALKQGHEVIGSETYGMSQRGGSVVSHLKLGTFAGPMIRRGTADLLIATNEAEATKCLETPRDGGTVVVNAPEGCFPNERLSGYIAQRNLICLGVDANQAALELGTPAVANMILLGVVVAYGALPFTFEQLAESAAVLSREHLRTLNREALFRGSQLVRVANHPEEHLL